MAYMTFLEETGGKDVWKNYPLRNQLTNWTCRAKDATDGGSIIDPLVTSENGIIEASVQVATNQVDYIPVMDHRLIIARVIPDILGGSLLATLKAVLLPKPRIHYPTKKEQDKERFCQFEQQTEEIASSQGLFEKQVDDNFVVQFTHKDFNNGRTVFWEDTS